MQVTFKKADSDRSLRVAFFWMLKIDSSSAAAVADYFIPELFYDYFYIHKGSIMIGRDGNEKSIPLARQSLKTLHTRQLTLTYTTPLVLFGARLNLLFAESYWGEKLSANTFLPVNWVGSKCSDLAEFSSEVSRIITQRNARKTPAPLLSPTLEESDWLLSYSARHKRRLYKKIFGVSKADIDAIQSLHTFLSTTCDFSSGSPRIIDYIDSDTYYDQPHLNRSFKKMTGLTPMEYFFSSSILQGNLMSASYNEKQTGNATMDS